MAKVIQQLQSPQGLFVTGIVGVVLVYAVGTRAIDTGSLGQYGLTLLLLVLSINLFVRAVRGLRDDRN
jgi:hypothetical protein